MRWLALLGVLAGGCGVLDFDLTQPVPKQQVMGNPVAAAAGELISSSGLFPNPFTFDVGRQPNEHVAFGFGTHFCLGNSLARLELVCMFEHLLRRLPGIELVDDILAGDDVVRRGGFLDFGFGRKN